jgi:FlaA1/EpsC-like NDP-sugar epimerase
MNVIDAAIDNGVKKVIALSTDKAVNPINLYGATKLCSDKLFIQANAYSGNKGTSFSVVRYGNVAKSRGSIIPFFESKYNEFMKTHFKESLKELQLPVTHEDMTRFYITIEQGVGLIAKAFKDSKGGEIFVAKIPSFKITDLVNSMGCSYEIVGIRPGEKTHECMITVDDSSRVFEQKDCYIIYPEDYKNKKVGLKVESNFVYSSDNNSEWLYK